MKNNDLIKARKRILENYCFHGIVGNELYCKLENGRYLVFKFFQKGNTLDLLLRKYLLYTGFEDEEIIKLSFCIDDEEHVDILNEWYAKRLNYLKDK